MYQAGHSTSLRRASCVSHCHEFHLAGAVKLTCVLKDEEGLDLRAQDKRESRDEARKRVETYGLHNLDRDVETDGDNVLEDDEAGTMRKSRSARDGSS